MTIQGKVSAAAGMFALTILAACGGSGDQPAQEQAAAPAAAAPAETPAMDHGDMGMAMPEGVTQAMVTEGEGIFHSNGNCFTCHGADAKGTPLAPDLTDDQWLNTTGHNYEEIVGIVTNGVAQPKQHPSPMPAKGGAALTEAQVHAVAAYVYSLSGH
jgi:cbb3-type cytochrome c oxidase subunit III